MKNRCYKHAKMKHQLFQMRRAKKRNPIWRLSDDQVEYIEKIGFPVVPHLYRITTRRIMDVRNRCGLLKEIHYSHVKGHKKYLYRTLSPKSMGILEENGVVFVEDKYEILLDQYAGRR